MEIVSIEKKTFDEMMARMGASVEKVAAYSARAMKGGLPDGLPVMKYAGS